MDKIGTIKISSATEYDREGFVVEQLRYTNTDEPVWCVPGWIEDCWGESGFFETEAKARDFLAMVSA